MTDDRKMELISAALDHELDAGDHDALEHLLDSSAEARDLQAGLKQLDTLLKRVPELEPPASLHAEIMAQAHPTAAAPMPKKSGWLQALIPGAGLRYAIAAATGALVAAVVINSESMRTETGDITDFVGTMAQNSGATSDIIDSFAFADGNLESLIQLQRSDGFLVLRVEVESSETVDISVDLSDAGLEADAIAQQDSDFESIAMARSAVQMRAIGHQNMSILLRRVDDTALAGKAEIRLEFSSSGRLLGRGALAATL